jgi:hypothetical protein
MMTEERWEQAIKIKNDMINEKNDQIVKLEMEVMRLRSELENIANVSIAEIRAIDFRQWAQNRARHALGLKPGELTIRKEKA